MPKADRAGHAPPPLGGDTSARYPLVLLSILALWCVALGIAPQYRQDWLLENMLVVVAVPILVATYRSLRFSNAAYSCLFAFFMLHEVGAHYTYSEVPYDAWMRSLSGTTVSALLGLTRNHFDRLVHFSYGALMLPVAVEIFEARAKPSGMWRFLMPVLFLASHGAIYEVIEWLAAVQFGGNLGLAYVGTQGDVWDAQKDMALVMTGAVLSMTVLTVMRRRKGGARR